MFAALLLGGCSGDDGGGSGGDVGYRGALVAPPFEKPGYTLTDTQARPYDIRKETEGYLTLLYIGYTHCPDVCPTHMAGLSAVMKKLPADVTRKIKVVFVTADPARDTPEVLGK